jgi:hypothetical protein
VSLRSQSAIPARSAASRSAAAGSGLETPARRLQVSSRWSSSNRPASHSSSQLNRALRPDYFLPLGDTGVLIEVERGKTTINNMDLLDFWKCHICAHAHYLILLVPTELRQNPTMSPRREFVTVRNRLASFFEDGNYTNVRGLFLFGY